MLLAPMQGRRLARWRISGLQHNQRCKLSDRIGHPRQGIAAAETKYLQLDVPCEWDTGRYYIRMHARADYAMYIQPGQHCQ